MLVSSPKNSINVTVFILGLLIIAIGALSSQAYYVSAREYQRQSLVDIAKIKAEDLLTDLKRNSFDFISSLAQEKYFKAAIKSKSKEKIEAIIGQNFRSYYVTTGLLKLERIRVYDDKARLIGEVVTPNRKVTADINSCHGTLEKIFDAKGVDRYKPIYELCTGSNRPTLTTISSIGLSRKGYIEIVIDPTPNLIKLEEALGIPMSILGPKSQEVIHYSDKIGQNSDESLLIKFPIVGVGNKPIVYIKLHQNISEFCAQFNRARNVVLAIIVCLVIITMLIIRMIMSKIILSPLKSITHEFKKRRISGTNLNNDAPLEIPQEFSELHELYTTLEDMALTDSLTGLSNRHFLEHKIDQLLTKGSDEGSVLCYLDLDKFKIVNDVCGHAAGDQLLINISDIFRAHVRSSDILARIGGDEFGIIMHNCSVKVAKVSAEKIRSALKKYHFTWGGRNFEVGVSIGIISIDADLFPNKQSLLQAVDSYCYVAKRHGGNNIQLFSSLANKNIETETKKHSISEISDAIKSGSMTLHYQRVTPTIVNTSLHPYYELLVRLIDAEDNIVAPNQFLPIADRYGIMDLVDEWVLTKTLEILSSDNNIFEQGSTVAINVSGKSLSSREFRTSVLDKITQANIPKNTLCIEITETAALSDIHDVVRFMLTLKEKGVIFALDDFGTGLASFDYLKRLPVDIIKIDGSFTKDISTNAIDYSIINSVINISKVMDLRTIAEYVENEEQFEILKDIGIDYAQGFFISIPKPVFFDPSMAVLGLAKRNKCH
jgi:diguanylate cyclase (GGDEF)-like protein